MKRSLFAFLLVAVLAVTPVLAYAQDSGLVECGPEAGRQMCELKDLFSLIVRIYNYMLAMAGVVAFAYLIYGGVQMLLFSVEEEKVKSGKSTVTQALIGIAIILLAYVIVNTLLLALGVEGGATNYFNGSLFGN